MTDIYTSIKLPKIYDFLFTPARYKVTYGGRGSAKSWTYAIALLLKGTQEPTRILCAREYQVSIAESVKSLLDKLIDRLDLGDFYTTSRDSICGANGTKIFFGGLKTNIDKIKSTEGIKYVWCEEAQNISQSSWDILIPTIREDESEIWVTFNTGLDTDATYNMFVRNERSDAIVRKINYYNNPFFPDVLKKEMEYCREKDPIKYNHIWEGEPQDLSDSLVFNKWTIKSVELPKDSTYYFGMDFGYAVDPTALIKCTINEDRRELYIIDEAYGYKVEIDNLPGFIDNVPDARANHITADSARPETISYLRKRGYYVLPSNKGPGSVIEGIEFLQNYDIIVDPKCKNTIYELSRYSYEIDKNTGLIKPKQPEDKDNHLIDALRYALERFRLRRKLEIYT